MDVVVLAEDFSGRVEHGLGNLNAARDCFSRSVDGCKATCVRIAFQFVHDIREQAERQARAHASVLSAGPGRTQQGARLRSTC